MDELDFTTCKYDIHKLAKGEKCLNRYRDLTLYAHIFDAEDLPEGVSSDFVLRYVIATYTASSPFAIRYGNLPERKMRVLEWLGISSSDDLPDYIDDLCRLRSPSFMFRVIFFLRVQSNEDWALLQMALERYWTAMESYKNLSNDPLAETRKQTVIDGLILQIQTSRQKFLAGEKSKMTEEALSFSIASESLNIRPEQYIPIWAETNNHPYDLKRI